MSFFKNIFGSSDSNNENSKTFWNQLTSIEDVDQALFKSKEKKIAIFKHSTRCFISKTVLRNFEKEVAQFDGEVHYYFLDLIQYRNISNYIAEKLNVEHQSPQLIVVENGVVLNNASHQNIGVEQLK